MFRILLRGFFSILHSFTQNIERTVGSCCYHRSSE